jgi:hypothetical protein
VKKFRSKADHVRKVQEVYVTGPYDSRPVLGASYGLSDHMSEWHTHNTLSASLIIKSHDAGARLLWEDK